MGRYLAWMFGGALACATAYVDPRAVKLDPKRNPEQQIADALRAGAHPEQIRVCEWEAPTGSHLREMTCRFLSDNERERAAAQLLYLRMNMNNRWIPPQANGSGGGL